MYAQQLGFASSWKMLTRDKGWIKPMLVLTLVSWIPILGQIAVLGYGLEWARLTAWGVDSAPKQRGVDYSKVLKTGGIAFLVMLSMGIVSSLIMLLLFGTSFAFTALPGNLGWLSAFFDSTWGVVSYAAPFAFLSLIVSIFLNTFILAATMRSTIYDGFTAGWRVDRLFQMVMRDPGGFVHTYVVTLIAGLINAAFAAVVTFIGSLFVLGGMVGVFAASYGYEYELGRALLHMGAAPLLLLFVVLAILVGFVGSVIATTLQMVSINAMGQWFCRFDVARWGVSSAPLPDGVPVHKEHASHEGGSGNAPVQPNVPTAEASAEKSAPQAPDAPAASPTSAHAAPAHAAPTTEGEAFDQFSAESRGAHARPAEAPVSSALGPIPLGPVTEITEVDVVEDVPSDEVADMAEGADDDADLSAEAEIFQDVIDGALDVVDEDPDAEAEDVDVSFVDEADAYEEESLFETVLESDDPDEDGGDAEDEEA